MEKVKIVFCPMLGGFVDVQPKERVIECHTWDCNENYYVFFLTCDNKKVLSIPKENVLYVEDIIQEEGE